MKAHWSAAILMVAMAAQAEPARFAITAHQVASALSSPTVQVADHQVTLLSTMATVEPDARLDVLQAAPARGVGGQSNRSLVKLRCHEALSCLPFYVLVEGEIAPIEAVALVTARQAKAAQPRPKIMLHAGAHATLLLDSARAHMQLAVVSLENGVAGSRVRVATLDRKEFYEGEVVGPNLLKGRF